MHVAALTFKERGSDFISQLSDLLRYRVDHRSHLIALIDTPRQPRARLVVDGRTLRRHRAAQRPGLD